MLKAVKVRGGISCDGYGRPLAFDLAALKRQWARADHHKAKRAGDKNAVAELAHAHLPLAVKPA